MLSDVIQHGTGRRARVLGRKDLAGKTGTTNDQRDAWFSGFNSALVATTWVGYDKPQPLGNNETGARAALPMWVDYMRVALQGLPEDVPERPAGLVTVRIDPDTGKLAGANNPKAIFEIFRADNVPEPPVAAKAAPLATVVHPEEQAAPGGPVAPATEGVPEELF
jgi:penicillin-binding protein 1A